MDAQNYLDMNIKRGGVLEAIRRKLKDGSIYVQYDGAKPHTGKQNVDKLTDGGWSIQYVTQSAQSPV